jgi:flagellar basal-body rod protein FlgC
MRIDPMEISASGLRAQRLRMEVITNNLANVHTTEASRSVETDRAGNAHVRHTPFRRQRVLFMAGLPGMAEPARLGVSVPAVVEDTETAFEKRYEPEHPHAVKNPDSPDFGYVFFPNVNPLTETVDMIAASRAYEANVTAVEALKSMGEASLRILA